MKRNRPYTDPVILTETTPAGCACALDRLAFAIPSVMRHAVFGKVADDNDRRDVLFAFARLCASRIQMLSYDLIVAQPYRTKSARAGELGSQIGADIALVRGWRRRFPGLLGR
jgi:hypothetical protein